MAAFKRAEIKVSGQVQGVFFRQGVKEEAERLGLTGWVRNEDEGTVNAVAEGKEEQCKNWWNGVKRVRSGRGSRRLK